MSSERRSQIFEKKKLATEFGTNGPKSGPKLAFYHFLKFGSIVFLEFTYSDSLQQCLTSSRSKIYKKFLFEPTFGPKEPKSGPKLGFFWPFSQVWFISFP